MAFEIPKIEFDPHPAGQHQGVISEVIDQGLQEGRYGTKPKLTIVLTSATATKPNGEPAELWIWCTVSAGRKATLTRLREKLLGRPLTESERMHFDQDHEMLGKKVGYIVEHSFSDDGRTFANLVSWSPMKTPIQNERERWADDGQGQAAQAAPPAPQPNGQQPAVAVADVTPDRTQIVAPFGRPQPQTQPAIDPNDVPF